MKIYTSIVMDSMTGKIEEEDSFEYDGPIAQLKDAPSPPPAPNYVGAAQTTSDGSVQAAIANNLMAHPNISTPLGSQTWQNTGTASIPGVGSTPGFDIPPQSQQINLTPQGQQLYSGELGLQTGEQKLGQGALDRTTASLSQPFDAGSVGQIADKAYGAMTSRLDPQWAQNTEMNDAKLANQGITPGSQAYNDAQRVFNQSKNDAYQQANLGAISTMPQTYQLATAAREQPLTELSSIESGTQPQMPQFQPTQYSLGAQGPNMLGAAQATGQYNQGAYNAQVGAQNSQMSGLFGLGGAGLNMYGMMNAAPLAF